jgi:sugar-specific transcriptional regulator TrmB
LHSRELIGKLQQIGFREYESKIFLALLQGQALSASEIAKRAGIGRTAVYDILKSFVERGFCNEIETNTILQYSIIDPRIIGDKIEREINKQNTEKISCIKDTFKDLEALRKIDKSSTDGAVNIELIRGFNKHRQEKFVELLRSAKKEVLFMIRLEGYVSEEIDESAKKFVKSGGIMKSIYELSLNFKVIRDNSRKDATVKDLIRLCKAFEKNGEQIRISEKELPNMTVFDSTIVFINISDKNVPRHSNADIIIRNPEFAGRMKDLFNFYWSSSVNLKELETKYH